MENILVHRYKVPNDDGQPMIPQAGWAGYIEPEDLSWIMYVHTDGHPVVFLNRDPETGAVLPVPETARPTSVVPGTTLGEHLEPPWDTENDVREPPWQS